ncbi:DUF3592 domain-containing protein [Desulfobacterales bacterium HSG17]|nr:DUF3592 domain-containing protein [Desulfobacterales bacterium HSG17]
MIMTIFSIMFILLGMIGLTKGVIEFFDALNSKKWYSTKGIITKSFIDEIRNEGTTYHHELCYQFIIDNKVFNSKRIYFGNAEHLTYVEALSSVEKISKGTIVKVHYSPHLPSESVLVKGIMRSGILNVWLGFLPLIIGLFIFVYPYELIDKNTHFILLGYFLLLWFVPVIWLAPNGKHRPSELIEIIK